jgi:hypothetical protein
LRRIASSSSQKVPNRPKPHLSRNQTVSGIKISRDHISDKEMAYGSERTESHWERREAKKNQMMNAMEYTSQGASVPMESMLESKEVVNMSCDGESTKKDVAVDPSIRTGMFHQATMSKLCVRRGSASLSPSKSTKLDEWVDSRKYNPYELIKTKKRRSTTPTKMTLASPLKKSTSRHVLLPMTPPTPSFSNQMQTSPNQENPSHSLDNSYDQPFELSIDEYEVGREPTPTMDMNETEEQGHLESNEQERAVLPSPSDFGSKLPFHHEPHIETYDHGQVLQEDDHMNVAIPREQIFAMEMEFEMPTVLHSSFERLLREPGPVAW